ncbi:MAG: methyl-accepting chemotaxis protein [Bacillota bacterium]
MDEVESRLTNKASDTGELVRSRLDTRLAELESIASRDVIKSMDWEEIKPVLEREIDRTEYATIALVETDGMTKYVDGNEVDLGDRDYVQKALDGNSNISEMLISRVIDAPVAMVATPVQEDGEIVGVLIARMLGEDVISIVADIEFGENGYAYMIDKTGTVVAHSDNELVMEQFNPLEEADENEELQSLAHTFENMIDKGSGFSRYSSFDNLDSYVGFNEVEGTNWIVGVTAPVDQLLKNLHSLRSAIIFVSVLIFLISLIIVYIVADKFSRPITKAVDYCESIAAGNLNLDKINFNREDELGDLAVALNKMTDNLKEIIVDMSNMSEDLSSSSQELSASSEEISASAEEVGTAMQQVASGAEEQLAQIDETETIMKELATQIDTVSDKADDMEAQTGKVINELEEGNQAVNNSIEQVNKVSSSNREVAGKINELGQLSGQIGKIVDLINGISEQTNLLALNAAIEAARAGKAGQGFSVVADEIRELAEESSEATEEISDLVNEIQQKVANTVDIMDESEQVVSNSVTAIENTENAFTEIDNAAHSLEELIASVVQNTEQMAANSEQVSNAITEVVAVSQEASSNAEQVAASSEQQSASTQQIVELAEQLTEMAQDLSEKMEQFEV